MVTPRLRGRAAQALRPGYLIKQVLSSEIPLETGERVREAAITDIHSVYKRLIKEENMVRPKERKLRGMTYRSFITLFRFAYLLGLVEKVREEPMLFPPPGGALYGIRKPDGAHVVDAKRIIYRLTPAGIEDTLAWSNLCKAWRENWPVPQKVEEVILPPPVKKPPRVPKRPPEIKEFKWVEVPSLTQFKNLLKYLRGLSSIGVEDPAVRKVIDDLAMRIGDWQLWIGDALEEAESIGHLQNVKKFTFWGENIDIVAEALIDRDLFGAIKALEKLVP